MDLVGELLDPASLRRIGLGEPMQDLVLAQRELVLPLQGALECLSRRAL
jgi:hypothetical protein